MPLTTPSSLAENARKTIIDFMAASYAAVTITVEEQVTTPPTDDSLWARIYVEGLPSVLGEIGATKRHRVYGFVTMQLFGPAGRGTKELLDILSALELHIRSKTRNGVTFRDVEAKSVGRTGAFFQANLTCTVYGDHIG